MWHVPCKYLGVPVHLTILQGTVSGGFLSGHDSCKKPPETYTLPKLSVFLQSIGFADLLPRKEYFAKLSYPIEKMSGKKINDQKSFL
jgi:hypothetical protein